MITGSQLLRVCNKLTVVKAEKIAGLLSELAPLYGLTKEQLPAFLGQVCVESACFSVYAENLNYSPEGLKSTFSYYRRNPKLAEKHGRTAAHRADQEAIANTAYADVNRSPNTRLGNTEPGDGWRFRGGGSIQATGREMFTEYARYKGVDIDTAANLVRTEDRWAIDIGLWVYAVKKKLPGTKTFEQITAAINTAKEGLVRRKTYYEIAKKVSF